MKVEDAKREKVSSFFACRSYKSWAEWRVVASVILFVSNIPGQRQTFEFAVAQSEQREQETQSRKKATRR